MLKEIRSSAFKSNGQIRPAIVFHDGLNVCKGPDDYPNSIGKSNFLMVIDFAFGGAEPGVVLGASSSVWADCLFESEVVADADVEF